MDLQRLGTRGLRHYGNSILHPHRVTGMLGRGRLQPCAQIKHMYRVCQQISKETLRDQRVCRRSHNVFFFLTLIYAHPIDVKTLPLCSNIATVLGKTKTVVMVIVCKQFLIMDFFNTHSIKRINKQTE